MRDYCFSASPLLVVSDRIRSEQVELEMSNLTSASNTEASVSSSGTRTVETARGGVGVGSSSRYSLEQQYSSFHPPPAQSSQPPPKKKRSLPGNPGNTSKT